MGPIQPQKVQELAPADAALVGAIILSGGLRPSPLIEATGVAALDLHLSADARVLDFWAERIGEVMPEPERIVVVPSRSCPTPRLGDCRAQLAPDTDGFRGPGGVVRDVAQDFEDGTILVIEAARHLDGSLEPLVQRHVESGAMATVAMNPDRSPAGIYAIQRSAIDLVPARGFMDLKEQWLPKVRKAGAVEVVAMDGRGASPLRTRPEFLSAARWLVVDHGDTERADSIWWSAGDRGWSVIAPGATVEPGAIVERSVVEPGARVGAGALVARSIVCEGAVVGANERVVDRVVRARESAEETRR